MTPKLLWDRIIKKKKHPGFLQRIGFSIPQVKRHPLIWIHAISVGEVKAAVPLLRHLQKKHPKTSFLITTTTATGQMEARRSLKEADFFCYLPIDLSFVVHRFIKKLNPKHFFLIESDFWPNLLKALKKNGTQISLVSGKISKKSLQRFLLFSSFSKWLFSHFDQICVQDQIHKNRFEKLVFDSKKICVAGNLKLDVKPQEVQTKLFFPGNVITLSCTHAPEEELLIDELINGDWQLIIAPRHPERFEEVAQLLSKRQIPFSRWGKKDFSKKVLLVDQMGKLPICYTFSHLVIVGGSFIDQIGGHNVLEPLQYKAPVFFGPFMQGQLEFCEKAIGSGAAKQLPINMLKKEVDTYFSSI